MVTTIPAFLWPLRLKLLPSVNQVQYASGRRESFKYFATLVEWMIQIRVREKSPRIQGDRWLEGVISSPAWLWILWKQSWPWCVRLLSRINSVQHRVKGAANTHESVSPKQRADRDAASSDNCLVLCKASSDLSAFDFVLGLCCQHKSQLSPQREK